MITDPLFYLLAIPAVTLLGLTKGGFAGLGMISTPLLALVVPPLEAAAILLPILICQDAISVWTYHRAWSAWNLKVLLPGSVFGVGAGWLFARYFSNAAIELTVGSIALVFVLYMWLGAWLRAYLGRPPAKRAAAASGHGRRSGARCPASPRRWSRSARRRFRSTCCRSASTSSRWSAPR